MTAPLLRVENLSVAFALPGAWWGKGGVVQALSDVSFDLAAGETLGIVGESGCGKSTLGRAVLNLLPPAGGRVLWNGEPVGAFDRGRLRALRRQMTVVFQDPLASLDPLMTVEDLVGEPVDNFEPALSRPERRRRIDAILERVGLPADAASRYPHQFSGGQCQRIGIARALILKPRLIVCDEAVSALDVSVQAQIIALLDDLRRERDLALLFISHNLAVVRRLSDRIMVLYLGRVMEIADGRSLFASPRHPYTRALLSAVPVPDPGIERERTRIRLSGELPSARNPPLGCVFHTRCPHAEDRCRTQRPSLDAVGAGHAVACHRWKEL